MSGVHALIIEDNDDSIDVLARLLQRQGVSFTAVSDPTTLAPADLDGVQVVFLDLDMPGMNGYDVFEQLRGEYGVNVPIVAYTSNMNEKATARSLGFNGMFGKPLDVSCFGDHLKRLLAGEAIWDDC